MINIGIYNIGNFVWNTLQLANFLYQKRVHSNWLYLWNLQNKYIKNYVSLSCEMIYLCLFGVEHTIWTQLDIQIKQLYHNQECEKTKLLKKYTFAFKAN